MHILAKIWILRCVLDVDILWLCEGSFVGEVEGYCLLALLW